MKKHISIILTVLVMILTIAACGRTNANNTADSDVSVDNNENAYDMEPDTFSENEGSEYGSMHDYFLNLRQIPGTTPYKAECEGVSYTLISWGTYLSVNITNNDDDPVLIGGQYKLQRVIGDEYVDIDEIDEGNNLFIAETHVRDMPLIILHNKINKAEILLGQEDEKFSIAPGQTIEAQFLTGRYVIIDNPDFAGDYRFIYGEAAVDFNLECDIAE